MNHIYSTVFCIFFKLDFNLVIISQMTKLNI